MIWGQSHCDDPGCLLREGFGLSVDGETGFSEEVMVPPDVVAMPTQIIFGCMTGRAKGSVALKEKCNLE